MSAFCVTDGLMSATDMPAHFYQILQRLRALFVSEKSTCVKIIDSAGLSNAALTWISVHLGKTAETRATRACSGMTANSRKFCYQSHCMLSVSHAERVRYVERGEAQRCLDPGDGHGDARRSRVRRLRQRQRGRARRLVRLAAATPGRGARDEEMRRLVQEADTNEPGPDGGPIFARLRVRLPQ